MKYLLLVLMLSAARFAEAGVSGRMIESFEVELFPQVSTQEGMSWLSDFWRDDKAFFSLFELQRRGFVFRDPPVIDLEHHRVEYLVNLAGKRRIDLTLDREPLVCGPETGGYQLLIHTAGSDRKIADEVRSFRLAMCPEPTSGTGLRMRVSIFEESGPRQTAAGSWAKARIRARLKDHVKRLEFKIAQAQLPR